MKSLSSVLALLLAAGPAGAAQLGASRAPSLVGSINASPVPSLAIQPVVANGIPTGLAASPAALSALPVAPRLDLPASAAAAQVSPWIEVQTFKPIAQMAPEAAVAALPVFTVLQGFGQLGSSKPGVDAQRLGAGFDGSKMKMPMATLTDPAVTGSGASNGSGGGAGGAGGGSSGGSGGSPFARVVARIELTGKVEADPRTGEAFKAIAPKVEQTPTSQTLSAVALTGKVDAQGSFTKSGVVAVRQSASASETALSATKKQVRQSQTSVQITAGLDGKAARIQSVRDDQTNVIETVSFDVASKQADFQSELAVAQKALKVKDVKALIAEVTKRFQTDLQTMIQGAVVIENKKAQDGSQNTLLAVLEGDDQGNVTGLVLVRGSAKDAAKPTGNGHVQQTEQAVYKTDVSGNLVEVSFTGVDHDHDKAQSDSPADAGAQAEFDSIVAKVAAP